ncbi:unnamed protein product [Pseudo-nitzschia multistriata]|uniref:MalT-like TPR region domain-containing protein n=1 Tax=Pseudo-nitzschia multistriata TaxID=183589 RepID=A0A448Z411_9STRA|nr:unnamed protein product [Pseudo-nitzschia multistriata]
MGAAASCPVLLPFDEDDTLKNSDPEDTDDIDTNGLYLLQKVALSSEEATVYCDEDEDRENENLVEESIVNNLEKEDSISIVFFEDDDEDEDDADQSHGACFVLPLFDAISSHLSTLAEVTTAKPKRKRGSNWMHPGLRRQNSILADPMEWKNDQRDNAASKYPEASIDLLLLELQEVGLREEDEADEREVEEEDDDPEEDIDLLRFELERAEANYSCVDEKKDKRKTSHEDEDEKEEGEPSDEQLDLLRLGLQEADASYVSLKDRQVEDKKGGEISNQQSDFLRLEQEEAEADLSDGETVWEAETSEAELESFGLDPKENTETTSIAEDMDFSEAESDSLRFELQEQSETSYQRREATNLLMRGDLNCNRSSGSKNEPCKRSSSFIDLQQLLFASPDETNVEDSSSVKTNLTAKSSSSSSSSVLLFSSSSIPKQCKVVVDVFETHSTQLKPRSRSDHERFSLQKAGIPFRKCRDPLCSCHTPTPTTPKNSSSNRSENWRLPTDRKVAYQAQHRSATEQEGDDFFAASFYSRRRERKRALKMLKNKAPATEEDDITETTAEISESTRSASSASFGWCGQQSIHPRAANTNHKRTLSQRVVRNQNANHNNIDRLEPSNRKQRSLSEDYVEKNGYGLPGLASAGTLPTPLPLQKSPGSHRNQRHQTQPSPSPSGMSSSSHGTDSVNDHDDDTNVNIHEVFHARKRYISEDRMAGINPDESPSSSGSVKPLRERCSSAHTSCSAHALASNQHPCDSSEKFKKIQDVSLHLVSPTSVTEEVVLQEKRHCLFPQRKSLHVDGCFQPQQSYPRGSIETSPSTTNIDGSQEREKALKHCRDAITALRRTIKAEWRRGKRHAASIREFQLQRRQRLQQTMQLTRLYYTMGLIHYQQCRYDTAKHVLEHGLETLVADRANSSIPFFPVSIATSEIIPVATEADVLFDADYNCGTYGGSMLPPLPTLDEVAPHFSNQALLLAAELVLAKGKIFAAQGLWNDAKQASGKVLQWSAFQRQRMHHSIPQTQSFRFQPSPNHQVVLEYWREWGPTTARAQALYAECFQRENRPDLAETYYQEALAVQRHVLGPSHLQVAETVYRIGNLHSARGRLDLAEPAYREALAVYRFHREGPWTTTDPHQSHTTASLLADEATVLASLGWIFLLRRDRDKAYWATQQALEATVHALGPSHRNVEALRYQMDCVQKLWTNGPQC